jgi:GMP synthase (glutamine-hydrolysing)
MVEAVDIVILRAGDPVESVAARYGDFAKWIAETIGDTWRGGFRVHDVREDTPLPRAADGAAFVITGSSSSVTEHAPWMLRTCELIRVLVEADRPLFGICFGHQLMAEAFGGQVTRNPLGREIGTVRVDVLEDDPLFEGVPRAFDVSATHVDSVARVPTGARVLAATSKDPVAAFAIGARARAVQFHPEVGAEVLRGYVRARASVISAEGLDSDAIHADVRDAPHGAALLRNFVRRFV